MKKLLLIVFILLAACATSMNSKDDKVSVSFNFHNKWKNVRTRWVRVDDNGVPDYDNVITVDNGFFTFFNTAKYIKKYLKPGTYFLQNIEILNAGDYIVYYPYTEPYNSWDVENGEPLIMSFTIVAGQAPIELPIVEVMTRYDYNNKYKVAFKIVGKNRNIFRTGSGFIEKF